MNYEVNLSNGGGSPIDESDDVKKETGGSGSSGSGDPSSPSGGVIKKAGRRKINIEFIDDKSRRHITFSKRKAGIMKKVWACN